MSTSELQSGEGFGIVGIRKHIQSLGGQLTIASQPGQGTQVTATVPLAINMPSQTTVEKKMHHEPETTDSHLDCR
jgi:chemotaxis protein histidine kinase CheA